jgi:hypothetical protein
MIGWAALTAWVLAAVFALLGAVHAYWAAGGRRGHDAALPSLPAGTGAAQPGQRVKAFTPSAGATLAVALALWGVAWLVALRAGLFGEAITHFALRTLLALVALGLAVRAVGDFRLVGFFKTVTGSRFAWLDTRVYSPLCLALALGLAWLAWAG